MSNIEVKKKGRKPSNLAAFERISKVKKGDSIIILNREWKLRTIPGAHIIRLYINKECKVETLADESGWKITAL